MVEVIHYGEETMKKLLPILLALLLACPAQAMDNVLPVESTKEITEEMENTTFLETVLDTAEEYVNIDMLFLNLLRYLRSGNVDINKLKNIPNKAVLLTALARVLSHIPGVNVNAETLDKQLIQPLMDAINIKQANIALNKTLGGQQLPTDELMQVVKREQLFAHCAKRLYVEPAKLEALVMRVIEDPLEKEIGQMRVALKKLLELDGGQTRAQLDAKRLELNEEEVAFAQPSQPQTQPNFWQRAWNVFAPNNTAAANQEDKSRMQRILDLRAVITPLERQAQQLENTCQALQRKIEELQQEIAKRGSLAEQLKAFFTDALLNYGEEYFAKKMKEEMETGDIGPVDMKELLADDPKKSAFYSSLLPEQLEILNAELLEARVDINYFTFCLAEEPLALLRLNQFIVTLDNKQCTQLYDIIKESSAEEVPNFANFLKVVPKNIAQQLENPGRLLLVRYCPEILVYCGEMQFLTILYLEQKEVYDQYYKMLNPGVQPILANVIKNIIEENSNKDAQ